MNSLRMMSWPGALEFFSMHLFISASKKVCSALQFGLQLQTSLVPSVHYNLTRDYKRLWKMVELHLLRGLLTFTLF